MRRCWRWRWGGNILDVNRNVLVNLVTKSIDSLDDTRSFSLCDVDLNVEQDEQHQIRRDDGNTSPGCQCSTNTVGTLGSITTKDLPVVLDLDEGCIVDETQVQDELSDLEVSNPLLPPDSNSSSSEEVVPVHHDMNTQVQSDRHPRDGSLTDKLRVT